MRPLGEPLREYGFAWPELLREFLLLGLLIPLIVALLLEGGDTASLVPLLPFIWIGTFFAVGIHLSRRPKIIVYDNGVGLKDRDDEKAWNWSQITRWDGQRSSFSVNGLLLMRYGQNHFYVNDERIFSVGTHRACADQLANLLILKMSQPNYVAKAYEAYRQDKTIQYDGVNIHKNGLGGDKQTARWDEIEQIDFKNDQLRIKRYTDKKLRRFAYVSPVASYALMGLIDRIRGTDFVAQKTAELARSRGQIWAGHGKMALKLMMIASPLIILVVVAMAYSNEQNRERHAGMIALNDQFGVPTGTACTNKSYNSYAYGDSVRREHKFLVINANDNENPKLDTDLQNVLPRAERATSGADLTTVVCRWSDPAEINQCRFGDGVRRTRYRRDYVLAIIDVERKAIIAVDYLPGSEPDRCPAEDPGEDLYGDNPTKAEFAEWLHAASLPPGGMASLLEVTL
jgi:hypothetical protein